MTYGDESYEDDAPLWEYRFMLLPFTGLLTPGLDPARFQTEPPACYRASWQLPGPESHLQATTS